MNKSHFAVTVRAYFIQWNSYASQQSESVVLQGVVHLVAR